MITVMTFNDENLGGGFIVSCEVFESRFCVVTSDKKFCLVVRQVIPNKKQICLVVTRQRFRVIMRLMESVRSRSMC